MSAGDSFEKEEKLIKGDLPEFWEGLAEDLKVEGVWLETGALAFCALGVGSVAGEEDADVHLVGFGF